MQWKLGHFFKKIKKLTNLKSFQGTMAHMTIRAECLLQIQTQTTTSRVEPFSMKEQRGSDEQIFTKGKKVFQKILLGSFSWAVTFWCVVHTKTIFTIKGSAVSNTTPLICTKYDYSGWTRMCILSTHIAVLIQRVACKIVICN